MKRDSQSNLNLATLRAVLEKEVDKHNLHQLPNGEFIALKSSFSEGFGSPEKGSGEFARKFDGSPCKVNAHVGVILENKMALCVMCFIAYVNVVI